MNATGIARFRPLLPAALSTSGSLTHSRGTMSRIPIALLAAAVLALGACSADASPRADTAADEQAVRDVSGRWLQLEQSKDAAGIASLFTADGVLYREDHDPVIGAAAIQAHIARSYQENSSELVNFTTDRIDVAGSGDLATEHGTWSVQNTGPNGTGEDGGKYITVYRKINGEWKVVADMSVSTTPAAPQM